MYLTAFLNKKSVQVNKNLEAKSKDKGKIGGIFHLNTKGQNPTEKCSCDHSSQKIKYIQATKQMKKCSTSYKKKTTTSATKQNPDAKKTFSTYQTGKN